MLLDARGIECSTGSACNAGVPQPSHVLLAMGCDDEQARGSLRFSLGHTSTEADVDALRRGDRTGRRAGPRGGRLAGRRRDVRPDARPGSDVGRRGLGGRRRTRRRGRPRRHRHPPRALAQPAVLPDRRPRLLHDRGLQRRPARCRRDRHPVLRLGPLRPLPCGRWSRTSSPSTPAAAPRTLACAATRRSSSPPCSTAALALGFDAVATGHYAQLRTGPDGSVEMHRAVDAGKDQSYVLGVLSQEQLAHSLFPLGDTPKAAIRAEAERRGSAGRGEAGQPRHLLHQRRRHRRLAGREAADEVRTARARSSTAAGEVLGEHEGSWRFTVGQRKGLRIGTPADDGSPRYVLDIEPVSGTVTVGPREALRVAGLECIRPLWCGDGVRRPRWSAPCSSARTARSTAPWWCRRRPASPSTLRDPAAGIAPGQAVRRLRRHPGRGLGDDRLDVAELRLGSGCWQRRGSTARGRAPLSGAVLVGGRAASLRAISRDHGGSPVVGLLAATREYGAWRAPAVGCGPRWWSSSELAIDQPRPRR